MSEEILLETIEKLNRRIENLEAINDIQLLMANYFCHHVLNPNEEINHGNEWVFWADREDSSLEVANFGRFVGFDNVKAFFEKMNDPDRPMRPGVMFWHDLATPQIVVADDGQTARGLWTSPGHETFGEHAEWAWGKVQADFIKVDGVWKIWHYHWYRIFRSPFETSWAKYDQQGVSRMDDKEIYRKLGGDPDRIFPPTYFKPFSKDEFVDAYPPTPEHYATWTDERSPV